MKKIKKTMVLLLMSMIAVFCLNTAKAVAVDNVFDQVNNAANGYWKIKYHATIGQTFKPTVNRLHQIAILGSSGEDKSGVIALTLTDTTTGKNVGFLDRNFSPATVQSWLPFNFVPDVELDTSHTYAIYLSVTSTTAYWAVSTNGNHYVDGQAIVDNKASNEQDFAFMTSGHNAETAAPAVAAPAAPEAALPPVEPITLAEQNNLSPSDNAVAISQEVPAASGETIVTAANKDVIPTSNPVTKGVYSKMKDYAWENLELVISLAFLLLAAIMVIIYLLIKRKDSKNMTNNIG